MHPFFANIWPRFFQVLTDSRKQYHFKLEDPTVHFLWSKFIADKSKVVAEQVQLAGYDGSSEAMSSHLRRISGHADEEEESAILLDSHSSDIAAEVSGCKRKRQKASMKIMTEILSHSEAGAEALLPSA